MPSTPNDAAGLFWTALQGGDPTIILLPKHLMWAEQATIAPVEAIPLGKARRVREGDLLTLVTWGNCVELVEESLAGMDTQLSVECIDLRSIAPWDRAALVESVQKTGRLLIVQEDNISASVGQMIVADLWRRDGQHAPCVDMGGTNEPPRDEEKGMRGNTSGHRLRGAAHGGNPRTGRAASAS